MPGLFFSAILGYRYEDDYISLRPDQKEVVDTQILRQLNSRFPKSLRKEWLNQPLAKPYVDLEDMRKSANALLASIPGETSLATDPITPICTYIIIDGAHRYHYTFGVVEKRANEEFPAELRASSKIGAREKNFTARLILTLTWEEKMARNAYANDADYMIAKLSERVEALEAKLAGTLGPDFHPGANTESINPHA